MPEIVRLDAVVSVVDALRMAKEFGCGGDLMRDHIDEEDIENLVIQQIEFCDVILLNKVAEVAPDELKQLKAVLKKLQPVAEVIETNYADVDVERIFNCHRFNFEKTVLSAGWIAEMEGHHEDKEHEEHEHHHGHEHHHDHDDHDDDDDEHEEHEHHHGHEGHEHHHHEHHHDGGEVEEYGIGTFVFSARDPFDRNKFIDWASKKWERNIIRCKGVTYFSDETNMSYMFEQAGTQKNLQESGLWIATAPEEDKQQMLEANPDLKRDWQEPYGDRMQKIVFIGQKMPKEEIIAKLNSFLVPTSKF